MNLNQQIIWSPGVTLEAITRQVIERAYAYYQGNKTQTANALGISIRTLDTRLDEYAVLKKQQEEADNDRRESDRIYLARARGQYVEPPVMATAQAQTNGIQTHAGVQTQSTAKPATEYEVSMPKRSEVQEMLPKHSSAGGHRGRR